MNNLDEFYRVFKSNFLKATKQEQCTRLFHGRGKTYSGLEFFNIDYYPNAIFISIFEDQNFEAIFEMILEIVGELTPVVVQRRYTKLVEREFFGPEITPDRFCLEGDLKFKVNLHANQNPGLFLDMKSGKKWITENSKDKSILNLFSYTCSVSVYALKAGASRVLNIDQKKSFLNIGRENHNVNELGENAEFRNWDVRKSINQIAKKGPFDIVFCDPPTNQGKSFYYKNDYKKIISKSHKLLNPNGLFVACLNTPFESMSYLEDLFSEDEREWELVERLFSSDDFPEIDKSDGLKIVVYRLLK